MLVLSRKSNESIKLVLVSGEEILLTFNDITDNKVKVGIQAPKEIKILRTELENKK